MVFALQPIAMANPKTLTLHWLEQSLTAFGTACFALAAWRLWRGARPGAAHAAPPPGTEAPGAERPAPGPRTRQLEN